ncbi:hypothetical protein LICSK_13335 [Leptospira interrogans serovar Copenhageni]|nr:hypothetical protein LICSK_13335 [Leptospira interrogans serovar Copenhageni]
MCSHRGFRCGECQSCRIRLSVFKILYCYLKYLFKFFENILEINYL